MISWFTVNCLNDVFFLSRGPTLYIHIPIARCSLYVLKVPLNTK